MDGIVIYQDEVLAAEGTILLSAVQITMTEWLGLHVDGGVKL